MKTIKLTQEQRAVVDNDTYAWAKDLKWYAVKHGNCFYARRTHIQNGEHKLTYLHHCVIGKPLNGFVVDHIDGDGLNNQRINLRIVSHSGNMRNTYKHRAGHLTGTKLRSSGNWDARVTKDGRTTHIGTFTTQEEAHKVAMEVSHFKTM
jgi:hypothetical protein